MFPLETCAGIAESVLRERAIAGKWTPRMCVAVATIDDHIMRVEIDILSTSAVHQSVPHIDFNLKIQKPPT
jgi:hypothetical protein